jgi:hypothetical protein
VNLCCEVVFHRRYMVVGSGLQRQLQSVYEQTQNFEPHLLVCVLQVNDARLEPTMVSCIESMLVDCHWAQMVSYRATQSCNCRLPDHVPELLLLATTPTCYSYDRPCPLAATPGSHQPPDSGKGSDSAAAGLVMSFCAS